MSLLPPCVYMFNKQDNNHTAASTTTVPPLVLGPASFLLYCRCKFSKPQWLHKRRYRSIFSLSHFAIMCESAPGHSLGAHSQSAHNHLYTHTHTHTHFARAPRARTHHQRTPRTAQRSDGVLEESAHDVGGERYHLEGVVAAQLLHGIGATVRHVEGVQVERWCVFAGWSAVRRSWVR
jgi:hypothetical protein